MEQECKKAKEEMVWGIIPICNTLLYLNNFPVQISKPTNLLEEIIRAAMTAFHLKNLNYHLPKVSCILDK